MNILLIFAIPQVAIVLLSIVAVVASMYLGLFNFLFAFLGVAFFWLTLSVRKNPSKFRAMGWSDLAISLWRWTGILFAPIAFIAFLFLSFKSL